MRWLPIPPKSVAFGESLCPGECVAVTHHESGPSRLFTILLWAALLGAVAIEISGFRTSHVLLQAVWSPEGLQRFGWYGLTLTCIGMAFWFKRQYFVPFALVVGVAGTLV